MCCFSWCFNVNIYCLKYWELRLVNWVKSLQPHFPRSSQSWPCWETFWYNLTSIVTSDGIFTYVHNHFPRFSSWKISAPGQTRVSHFHDFPSLFTFTRMEQPAFVTLKQSWVTRGCHLLLGRKFFEQKHTIGKTESIWHLWI